MKKTIFTLAVLFICTIAFNVTAKAEELTEVSTEDVVVVSTEELTEVSAEEEIVGGRTVPHYNINIHGGSWNGTYYKVNGETIKDAFFCDGTYTYYLQADGTPMKNKLTYHPDGVNLICFDESGHEVFDAFFCDGTYTYYLQADGTPMKNKLTYHPDGVHLIYFDESGHEVFNAFQYCKDVEYTCYFNSNGYMIKNEITFSNGSPYYLDSTGRMKQGEWFKFDNGVDLGYANEDGSLINNGFGFDTLGNVVFYHWNGMVARGLITDGTWYYHMDETDGHLLGSFTVVSVIVQQELNMYTNQVINEVTNSNMTQEQKLRACYNWVVQSCSYKTVIKDVPAGYTDEQWYAINMFKTQKGNCYSYAAAFSSLAKALGYDAKFIQGSTGKAGGGWTPHGWVLINNVVYDPEMESVYGKDCYAGSPYRYKYD